jgi:membrane peptidoglycan carboxypeptidase
MRMNKMAIIKTLNPDQYSQARKEAMREKGYDIKMEEPKMVKNENKKKTLDIIKETLGKQYMSRKQLKEESGLTLGQIAGCIFKSQKSNGILKFEDGKFFIQE